MNVRVVGQWTGVFCLLFVLGCRQSSLSAPPKDAYFKTHFQDESQFITEAIITDLAEMIYYARNKSVPEELSVSATETKETTFRKPVYQVEVSFGRKLKPVQYLLRVDKPIWEPELYRGLATALAQSAGLQLPGSPAAVPVTGLRYVTNLATLTAANLEAVNQELSAALQGDFQNPDLHETAAFTLGAFVFRDFSGNYYDVRSPLCRMTAHLSFAGLLGARAGYGPTGQLAAGLLSTAMVNQKDALEKVSPLERQHPEVGPWVRAIQMRNTSDYRAFQPGTKTTVVETIAWAAAYSDFVDTDTALRKVVELGYRRNADFSRIANAGLYSVGVGHQLLKVSLPLELNEISEVSKISFGRVLRKEELINELNRMPERCFSHTKQGTVVRVIGWGQWAFFLQKHLCHAMHHNFQFMYEKWGVKDDAKQFAATCQTNFAGLYLYPFVQRLLCTESNGFHQAVDDGFKLTVQTPHLVPALMWNYLCYYGPKREHYQPVENPHVNEWHKHNPPPGTCYNIMPRMNHPSLTKQPDAVQQIEQFHAAAPYDYDIAFFLLKQKYRENANFEQMRTVYAPITDYCTSAMSRLCSAAEDQPAVYEELASRMAALDPDRYFKLGNYFSCSDEKKALGYYEKGLQLGTDDVTKSSAGPWLVKYYLRNGQREKASELADQVGEVYSHAGLRAKAEYLELVGRHKQALDTYLKIVERYEACVELAPFAYRCRDMKLLGTEKYWKPELAKHFPNGLESTTLASFNGRPDDGVIIIEQGPFLRGAGLEKGDVIVAIDGVRVRNSHQYYFAQNLTLAPDIEYSVWRAGRYIQVKAHLADHRIGGKIENYRRQAKA